MTEKSLISKIEYFISEFENEDSDKVQEAIAALGQIGAEAVPTLIEAFTSESEAIRYNSIFALAAIGEPAVEPLIAALNDDERFIRMFSIGTLGEIKDIRALEPLLKLLETEEDWNLRWWLTAALGSYGEQIVPVLISRLAHTEGTLFKRGIAIILGDTYSKDTIQTLVGLTDDRNIQVRSNALKSLGRLNAKEGIERLSQLTNDPNEKIRDTATEVLAKVQNRRIKNE
jgi:bilin biosynthesis protein